MRVLVTGHNVYIGRVLLPLFHLAGHEIVGLDTDFNEGGTLGPSLSRPEKEIRKDICDIGPADLEGVDAVVHLVGLVNDPVGDLDADVTYDINHCASVHLAETAKRPGVVRFFVLFFVKYLRFGEYASYCGTRTDFLDNTVDRNPYKQGKYLPGTHIPGFPLTGFGKHDLTMF